MEYLKINFILSISMGYLDPGSGSIIIQLLLSALVGLGFYFRSRWGSIKNIFQKNASKSEEEIEDDDFDI